MMLAALGLADSVLLELFLKNGISSDREALQSKVLETVKLCQEMLSTELPERFSEYWGSVRSRLCPCRGLFISQASALTSDLFP